MAIYHCSAHNISRSSGRTATAAAAFAPSAEAFDQAAAMLHPRVILAKCDTQEEQEIADRMRIQGVPTLVLFRGGQELARVSGARSAADLVAWTRQHLH